MPKIKQFSASFCASHAYKDTNKIPIRDSKRENNTFFSTNWIPVEIADKPSDK